MSAPESKRLVRRFYTEAINERDLEAVERPLSVGFTHNGEHRGRGGQREAVATLLGRLLGPAQRDRPDPRRADHPAWDPEQASAG